MNDFMTSILKEIDTILGEYERENSLLEQDLNRVILRLKQLTPSTSTPVMAATATKYDKLNNKFKHINLIFSKLKNKYNQKYLNIMQLRR